MNLPILRPLALAPLLAAAFSAHATLLDFEDLVPAPNSSGTTSNIYVNASSKGYSIPAPYPYLAAWTPTPTLGCNYTGSVALFMDYGRTVTLTQTNGAAFNLASMDLANLTRQSYLVSDNRPITFTGILAGGGTVTQAYIIPRDDALHTVAFVGFAGLSSVSWTQSTYSNGEFQFDNILVNPVPEPTTLAALGLGALGLICRRKRS